jgi:hypothetical protein
MRKFRRQIAFNGLIVGAIIVKVATVRATVLEMELDILLPVVLVQLSGTAT